MTTPQSRTGKLMQGLFGRFGKKNPPIVATPTKQQRPRDNDFPITGAVAQDEEETNWDDEETLDSNNPILNPQPIVPLEPPPPIVTSPDLESWDEALPAATVNNNTTQETRRSKNQPSTSAADPWGDNIPNVKFQPNNSSNPQPSSPTRFKRAIGIWAAILQQLRHILPSPVRQLSDAILTAILVVVVTIGILFLDGFFSSPSNPQIVTTSTTAPITTTQIGPEQAFIEAIETQLSDITSKYPDDIIHALQVDSDRNLAIVQLNPVWYLISDEQQDRVADRMWLQARANHLTKLELRDTDGNPIARSPVVGQHTIVLRRRQSY
jgi:hypothetical protein